MRNNKRANNQLRDIVITRNFTKHAEGSVLIEFGATKVICTASVEKKVPPWLRGKGQGWVTAEYGMLPRATHDRIRREAKIGQGGRTMEIQRLIGRSLRAAVDLKALGETQITVDCDVIQADGGTRTAAITGGFVALVEAINSLQLETSPLINAIASVSVGIVNDQILLDLEYDEDSNAQTDMNVVMTDRHEFIEVQGTAEEKPYTMAQLQDMLQLAQQGIQELIIIQQEALQ